MRLIGVGVDLISLDRARRFLKTHGQKKTKQLLTPSEKSRFKKSFNGFSFAKIFSAKEAFFKALAFPWMGLEGFRNIDIELRPGRRFHAKTENGGGRYEADGHFFISGRLVGAQVTVWAA